jgi:hypothetical protein
LQSEDSSRRIIPVEGFSILASQLDSGADLAVSEGAHHPGVLLAVRAWISSSSGVAICIRFFLYCDYCKLYLLYLIYTLDLKLVFPGGVLSRVMLTKNTCVYTCILVAVISS